MKFIATPKGLFGTLSLGNVALGTGATLLAATAGRPLLVGLVRAGMGVVDFASGAWNEAVSEVQKIKTEALALKTNENVAAASINDVIQEIAKLRADVAALKNSGTAAAPAKATGGKASPSEA